MVLGVAGLRARQPGQLTSDEAQCGYVLTRLSLAQTSYGVAQSTDGGRSSERTQGNR
jgi:hypothetical protein